MHRTWILSTAGTVVTVGIISAMISASPRATRPALAATPSFPRSPTGPKWGTRTLASVAEMLTTGAHDQNPVSAVYFVTNRGQANRVTSGDQVVGGSMPVDVVVMHGAFSNPKWSMPPSTAPLVKGNTLEVIVDAKNGDVVDMGLTTQTASQTSAMLNRLASVGPRYPLTVKPNS